MEKTMKVFYEKTPPKSRVRSTPPHGGTCFTLNWEKVAAGAQLFRTAWICEHSKISPQNFSEKFKCVVVSDEGVTFYLKDGGDQSHDS